MSSLDSALNAAASLLTMDLVRPARPDIDGRRLLALGRAFTLGLIAVAALYAPLIERFGSLFQYFQSTLAYIVPPIVAVYFGGLFCRRVTAGAAFPALAAGLALGLTLFLGKEVTGLWQAAGLPAVHFTYMALALFAFSAAVLALVSLRAPAPEAAMTFRKGDLAPETPPPHRLADYRVQAAGLAALTAAMLLWLW
jgi:SSS family solute:Na+ symporter